MFLNINSAFGVIPINQFTFLSVCKANFVRPNKNVVVSDDQPINHLTFALYLFMPSINIC